MNRTLLGEPLSVQRERTTETPTKRTVRAVCFIVLGLLTYLLAARSFGSGRAFISPCRDCPSAADCDTGRVP